MWVLLIDDDCLEPRREFKSRKEAHKEARRISGAWAVDVTLLKPNGKTVGIYHPLPNKDMIHPFQVSFERA